MPKASERASVLLLLAVPVFLMAAAAVLFVASFRLDQADPDGWLDTLCLVLGTGLLGTLGLGVHDVVRHRPEPDDGLALTRAEHPLLWAELDGLAAQIGTPPVDRLLLWPEAGAAVTQGTWGRELGLGFPLLAEFTVGELRAVMAHELGHFAGGDADATARMARWHQLLVSVRDNAVVPLLWDAYEWLFDVAAGPTSRERERRADAWSVQLAGRANTVSALRHEVEIGAAWETVLSLYAPLMDVAGRRAPLLEALHETLRAGRRDVAEEVARLLTDDRLVLGSTHPPVGRRLAGLQQLPDAPARPGDDAAASSLLGGGEGWLRDREADLFSLDLPDGSWAEIVEEGLPRTIARDVRDALEWARYHQRVRDLTYAAFFELAERDGLPERAGDERLDGDDPGDGEEDVAFLCSAAAAALVESGLGRVRLDWTGPARVVALDGRDFGLRSAAPDASGASARRLRSLLFVQGADLSLEPGSRLPPAGNALEGAATDMRGPWPGKRDVLVWTTGLLSVPVSSRAFGRAVAARPDRRLRLLKSMPFAELRSLEGADWIPLADVRSVRGEWRYPVRLELSLADGTTATLRGSLGSEDADSVYLALSALKSTGRVLKR